MFAPQESCPPYYPSYSPPEPQELTALLHSKAFMPQHGMGAWNETWKIQHGIYLSEQKEQELASAEVQRTTASLLEMQKLLKAKARGGAPSSDASSSSGGPGALSADPSTLIYTDPHSYAYAMERKNVALLSAFALGSDKWATLKTTPFLHYLYHGVFAIDVGRLDLEWFDIAMQFLDRTPNMHTLLLHDGWHLAPAGGGGGAAASRTRSRGHPVKEKGGVMGGGSAGAPKKAGGGMRRFPDERRVLEKLEQHLPAFLARNANSLVHLELAGLLLADWEGLFRLVKRCTNLQRLYLRHCNVGDRNFEVLSPILRASLPALNHLVLSGTGLTALSGSLLAGLVKVQAEKRNTMHWAAHLRDPSGAGHTRAAQGSLLLPNNLAGQGLVSLDLSGNALGDTGVSLVAQALARDAWVKAVDLSGNAVGQEGLRSIIAMLEENQALLWVQVQGSRELNANFDAGVASASSGNASGPGSGSGPGSSPERKAAFVPRVGQSPSHRAQEALVRGKQSSARLLARFDPHRAKRAKRVLLLFHAQQLDTAKFLTGREPLSSTTAAAAAAPSSSPRSSARQLAAQQPLAPGAQNLFDAFFHPAPPPALHNGSFDNDALASPGPAASPRPRSAAALGRARVAPGSNELLSPSIRSIAAARLEAEQQQQQFSFTGAKQRRSYRSRSRSPVRASALITAHDRAPQRAALAFLFPHLALVCTPDKLLQPDIALRGKPARTDNSWPAGYRPPEGAAAGTAVAPAPVPAGSPLRARPSSASATGAPSTPHSAGSSRKLLSSPTSSSPSLVVGSASVAPPHSRPDPLQSHLDFRPMLRETCVASTAEYIAAEKAAYKRRLRAAQERDLSARLDHLGRGGSDAGPVQLRLQLAATAEEDGGAEEFISVQQHQHQPSSGLRSPSAGSAVHSRLHSPLHSPLQLRSPSGSRTPHAGGGSVTFSPLGEPARRIEGRPLELGAQHNGEEGLAQAGVVAELVEENRRMRMEMERLQRERERERERERDQAHADAFSPSSRGPYGHAEAAIPASAPAPAPAPGFVPRRFPHLPSPDDPFDVACMPALLSAASVAAQSPVQDPELLAYLEKQFAKLHAYMDLMDAAVEPALTQQQQQQQHPAPTATAERAEHQYSEPQHHSSSDGGDALSRSHPSVERVERSSSPSQLVSQSFAPTATATSAADHVHDANAAGARPVISRSGSFDESPPAPAPVPGPAPSEAHASQPSRTPAAAAADASLPAVEVEVEESIDESAIQEELQAGVAERISDMFGLEEDE